MTNPQRNGRPLRVEGPDRMIELGAALGRELRPGDVVLLHGDLGAGKTTLAQGIARSLGVSGPVQSPTFTLVAEYDGAREGTPLRLYHLDLYRLTDPAELESIGYESYITQLDGVTLIEWPERAADWLPEAYLLISIGYDGPARQVRVRAMASDDNEGARLRMVIDGLGAESPHPGAGAPPLAPPRARGPKGRPAPPRPRRGEGAGG